MISPINARIKLCAIHRVGNKLRDEGCLLSESQFEDYDSIHEFLIEYFFTPFKSDEYFFDIE